MLERGRRALRLAYLVGRAIVHTLTAPTRVDGYCPECRSVLVVGSTGEAVILASGGRPCPVHVARVALSKADLPRAKVTR